MSVVGVRLVTAHATCGRKVPVRNTKRVCCTASNALVFSDCHEFAEGFCEDLAFSRFARPEHQISMKLWTLSRLAAPRLRPSIGRSGMSGQAQGAAAKNSHFIKDPRFSLLAFVEQPVAEGNAAVRLGGSRRLCVARSESLPNRDCPSLTCDRGQGGLI